jgi:hypothetical protein
MIHLQWVWALRQTTLFLQILLAVHALPVAAIFWLPTHLNASASVFQLRGIDRRRKDLYAK